MSHPEPQPRRDENSGMAFWRTSAQPRVLAFTGKRAGLPAVGPATDSGCELTEKGKSGKVAGAAALLLASPVLPFCRLFS